jgi:hypothetical protein
MRSIDRLRTGHERPLTTLPASAKISSRTAKQGSLMANEEQVALLKQGVEDNIVTLYEG